MTQETAMKLFESKKVRSVWDSEKGKWFFSIVDVVEILTAEISRATFGMTPSEYPKANRL